MGKSKAPKTRRAVANVHAASSDLRNVPILIERLLAGEEEAQTVLMGMGRHAAFLVLQAAEDRDSPVLRELGRKLAAIPPQSDTNIMALRKASVQALVNEVGADAPSLFEAAPFRVGPEVALFDPVVLAEDLAGAGRPRRSPERLGKGDLAWFGLPDDGHALEVRAGPPPDGQATLRLRVRVRSGFLWVGPPEATDGHRLGAVRLDPHSTGLHGRRDQCRGFAVPAAVYAVHGWRSGQTVHLRLQEEPKPLPFIQIDLAGLRLPEA